MTNTPDHEALSAEARELPEIHAEGERIVADTHKQADGRYLWTDVVGAVQTAIYEERKRHSPSLSRAPVVELEWRGIETAPKDGTLIILSSAAARGAWVGRYTAVYTSGFRPANPWQYMMLNQRHLEKASTFPTHWLPLPAHPQSEVRRPDTMDPELIERLLDAQQDINLAANQYMSQSLADASALIDEIEPLLRAALAPLSPPQSEGKG